MSEHTLSDAQNDTGDNERIWFRRSRRMQLKIWKTNSRGKAILSQCIPIDVLDTHSYHDYVTLGKGGFFGEKSVNVSMGPLGTPTSLTAKSVSGLADFFKSLAGVPGDASTALSTTSTALSTWQGMNPSLAKQQTAALQDQIDLLTAREALAKLQVEIVP